MKKCTKCNADLFDSCKECGVCGNTDLKNLNKPKNVMPEPKRKTKFLQDMKKRLEEEEEQKARQKLLDDQLMQGRERLTRVGANFKNPNFANPMIKKLNPQVSPSQNPFATPTGNKTLTQSEDAYMRRKQERNERNSRIIEQDRLHKSKKGNRGSAL